MALWRLVRRCLRSLWVVNLAACWLALREGRTKAGRYLHHLWTAYLWRHQLLPPVSVPLTLPRRPFTEVFPSVDLSRVELLYPLPRPGSVTFEELVVLACLVRHLRPKRLVEIGTAEGRTTLNFALHAPEDAEIITLDLPPEQTGAPTLSRGPDYAQLNISEPGVFFRHHPDIARKIRLVLANSTTFDWTPYERSVDFVFLDGAHDYESVRKDSENALRIVRPGGVIVWHDYGNWDGVSRCLNELGEKLPIVWLEQTSLACLKVEHDDAAQDFRSL
ncbi:hypothetical protein HRbin17_02741 [bacterium HR17]|uniref:Class I SAM-dependent methyltransferase n=1 Tax=Candidatus Fervidibacter japonicus TaxID=2035412 RepID=A0A2H5XG91_9BACT|nr:hypothetical protein HRbin17_02741 [bacterium HR17]